MKALATLIATQVEFARWWQRDATSYWRAFEWRETQARQYFLATWNGLESVCPWITDIRTTSHWERSNYGQFDHDWNSE